MPKTMSICPSPFDRTLTCDRHRHKQTDTDSQPLLVGLPAQAQRIAKLFKLAVTVHQCLNGRAPPYLSEHCIPVSSADTRQHLRSANRHLLAVPRFRLAKYSRLLARWPGTHSRILSWIQRAAQTVLGVYLKRTCSRVTSASISALGVLNDCAQYKSTHSCTHSVAPAKIELLCLKQCFLIRWLLSSSHLAKVAYQILPGVVVLFVLLFLVVYR